MKCNDFETSDLTAVIVAGGKGTRLSGVSQDIPKPMVSVDGMPILEREIEQLKAYGITDIIITVSYLAEKIIDYFGDGSGVSPITGRSFGVNISYYEEKVPIGNAGALFYLKEKLSADFLLLNADSFFAIDFNRMMQFHKEKGGLATIFTHPNNHPYDSGIIVADKDGAVIKWISKEDEHPKYYKNRVNAGIHILSSKIFDSAYNHAITSCIDRINTNKDARIDLDRDILVPLVDSGMLYCYDSPEYVKDMGTPKRLSEVERDCINGIPESKRLSNSQIAIFLDRDGTMIKKAGFLKDIGKLELLEGVSDAIRAINRKGFLAIIVTNQPVIARGEVTLSQLDMIHNKLETLLGNDGAYIDDIFFCPHHPDKGFKGEVPELKIECDCRKPKPGMLFEAAKRYNIDLERSWMVGDSEKDILAGKAAGCHTALIASTEEFFGQDKTFVSLYEFVKFVTNE